LRRNKHPLTRQRIETAMRLVGEDEKIFHRVSEVVVFQVA
jgi:hypothetical protein